MSDEAVEETLDKVTFFSICCHRTDSGIIIKLRYLTSQMVNLLAYVSDKDLFAEFYRYKFYGIVFIVIILFHLSWKLFEQL